MPCAALSGVQALTPDHYVACMLRKTKTYTHDFRLEMQAATRTVHGSEPGPDDPRAKPESGFEYRRHFAPRKVAQVFSFHCGLDLVEGYTRTFRLSPADLDVRNRSL
jgi:hypothetical protein